MQHAKIIFYLSVLVIYCTKVEIGGKRRIIKGCDVSRICMQIIYYLGAVSLKYIYCLCICSIIINKNGRLEILT